MLRHLFRRDVKTWQSVRHLAQKSSKQKEKAKPKDEETRNQSLLGYAAQVKHATSGKSKTPHKLHFLKRLVLAIESLPSKLYQRRDEGREYWWKVFKVMCALVPIYHMTTSYFFEWRGCQGESMLPTIARLGDTIIVSKRYGHGTGIEVGDLVSYYQPMFSREMRSIKRVMGMPGDFVLRDTPGVDGEAPVIQVPEGHCWVVGDNLPWSRDSRMYGPVPLALIIGKVVVRFKGGNIFSAELIGNPLKDAGSPDDGEERPSAGCGRIVMAS